MCKLIHDKYQGRVKLAESLKLPASHGKILQICHVNGTATVEDSRIENEGLEVEGIVAGTVLYLTDHENKKYEVIKKEIPFTHQMNNLQLTSKCKWKIVPMTEQCSGVILDENHIEVKIVIGLDIFIEEHWERVAVTNVKMNPFSDEVINNTPGIVVYIPEKRENIWNIGKRYRVSQESIKEMNRLTGCEIEKGQKILLVKGNC